MIFLFLTIISILLPLSLADPIVDTAYGKVQGFTYPLENDLSANIFLRISFAESPIGKLRLEKPQEPQKWSGVHNSTYYSKSCVQHSRKSPIKDTDEDCLYLNIIAPAKKASKPYPVLFWIHASGWEIGSGVLHHYKGIAERWVPEEIIVVTINYRLGMFGFMATGTEDFPGNLGLWDQVAALKWVKENIQYFGGDPEKITIWGASAGGASVSALTVSPHSRDLFQQAIQMSGSLYAEWSTTNRVIDTSEKLAAELKCSFQDSREIKECMKKKTVDEIQDAIEKLGTSRNDLNNMIYNPRIDGDFFPDSYEELIKKAPKKPTMIGFSEDEGSIMMVMPDVNTVLDGTQISYEKRKSFKRKDVATFIKESVVPEKVFGNQAKEVQEKIKDFYLNRAVPDEADNKFWLQRYTDLNSDVVFNVPCLNDAIAKIDQGWPVYFYFSEYFNDAMLSENVLIRGSPHLSEYPYLFGFSFYQQFPLDENDLKYQKYWIQAISSFVKTRKPSLDSIEWTQFKKDELNFMRFTLEPHMEKGLKFDQFHFWNQLSNKYAFDIVKGIDKENLLSKDEL